MEKIIYDLYLKHLNFNGDSLYWKKATANSTIDYRKLVCNEIRKSRFGINTQKKILKWGGIHRFKQFSLVKKVISDLDKNNKININTAKAISSYSKLFGFYKPKEYFILDARVCYVYNKLIISSNIANKMPVKFDINRSRNKTLITKYRTTMGLWNSNTKSVEDFYPEYCKFIRSTHKYFLQKDSKIFSKRKFANNDPEIIEMFLFFIADYI